MNQRADTLRRQACDLLKQTLQSVTSLVAPTHCAGCQRRLGRRLPAPDFEDNAADNSEDHIAQCFCRDCQILADSATGPACPVCAEPRQRLPGRAVSGIDLLCHRCRAQPPEFDAVSCRWLYRDSVSEAIRAAKYGGQLWRARRIAIATRSWARSQVSAENVASIGVCPVPMADPELRRRGFNLAALLAKWWFGDFRRPVRKTRETAAQAKLSWADRTDNLAGVFSGDAELPTDDWLVVDDVVTTGTTARRVASVLTDAGASRVRVVALARATRFDAS